MEQDLTINTQVTLNNGVKMPLFGLGTYQAHGKEVTNAVRAALDYGYRLIDTAAMYGNEEEVGNAVRESGIPRGDVFVTTKLWNSDHGYRNAQQAFEQSLSKLDLGYIDLYLIHWPVEGLRSETWKALSEMLGDGKVRAIGVSNYLIRHLEDLLSNSDTVPAVNQVEFSPFLYQKELHNYCREHNIHLEAYSPLTKGRRLSDVTLAKIASRYNKSVPQLLIRWTLQHGLITIPKSANPERIRENAEVFDFEISDQDMETLNSMNENLRTAWDPSNVH